MSQVHFLVEKSKDSISHSRQGWQYLVQRILNNEFSSELKLLQIELNSNFFQRYRNQLTNEYEIKEDQRIYKVHLLPFQWLPTRQTIKSMLIQAGSVLRYSTVNPHMAESKLIPSVVLNYQAERGQKKSLTQKRVTIIPPSKSTDTSDKQTLSIEDNSLNLVSPKWRSSIDEQHISSSLDAHTRVSVPSNEIRQLILQTIRRSSTADIPYDNIPSRLSLRSISYGFGLGRRSSDQKKLPNSSVNYRLPANKIELDLNQQDIGSFQRN